jgi:outer membrane protein assembly factor BamA
VSGERRSEESQDLAVQSVQYTVGMDQRLRFRRRTEVAWSYEFNRIRVTTEPIVDEFPFDRFDVVVNVSRILSSLTHDRRDTPFDATKGFFHSSNVEIGSSLFGSELHFYKYVLQQFHYRQLGGLVVAGAARLGLAWGYGDVLIPSERYFAGGASSVRGYPEDSLGPPDILGGTAGGAARLVLNGELRFPIYRWLRGAGFVDAGNAFETVSDIAFGDLRVGIGGGLRLATPFALFRVDLGVPATPFEGSRTPRWYFSIGQMF